MPAGNRLHEDYIVAWICALPLEMAAARSMLDETHSPLPQLVNDDNTYALGKICGYNVVVTCLPAGVYGTAAAATVVSHMRSTFPNIRFGLMVGIGGGVPNEKTDIRLGDVVVSRPTRSSGGVIQYDSGKTISSGCFEQTGVLNQPPQILLAAISQLQSTNMIKGNHGISDILSDIFEKNPDMTSEFFRPLPEHDRLFNAKYDHPVSEDTCVQCDRIYLVDRKPRTSNEPQVHYGLIASGNQVMKHGQTRDRLAKEHGIVCFEMEAAGLMNQLSCLVIRGICDYSDSHKNKKWQGYAALTAAAYAKVLLSVVPSNQVRKQKIQKACWMVPFERNPRFSGRDSELKDLEKMIFEGKSKTAAITGLGGVGKTQVVLELAYQVRDRLPQCSVFWITSTSLESIEQSYIKMSEQLGVQDVTPADVKDRVKAYLSQDDVGQWLLIYDNTDDMDMWMTGSNVSPALKSFLPQSHQGFIIFTSRDRQLAVKLAGPVLITLPEMDEEAAINMLRISLVQNDLLEDSEAVTTLLRQLTFLPLAITQVAAYINETGISLADYVSLLEEQEEDTIELLSKDFEDKWRYVAVTNPVTMTWLISFDQIRERDSLAAEYLSLMACIDPRDIPPHLLPPGRSRVKQHDALGVLKAYSFITVQPANQFLSLHRLVHLATRNWLRKENSLEQWTLKAGTRLKSVFPNSDYRNRRLWREYLPHAQFILQSKEFHGHAGERVVLQQRVGRCLYSDGRYNEAEELFLEVLKNNENIRGLDNPDTLVSMANLASTYRNQGRWTEAEKLSVQVLETRKTILGPEHPDTLASMFSLSCTYRKQGRWTEAEKLEVQVLETRKTVLGPEHPDTLASMFSLSCTYRKQGRWTEAEKLEVLALETKKTVLGPEHPDTLISMFSLASTYRNQGRWAEAEKLDVQVMEARKIVLGSEHPETLASMANLASTYWSQGRWAEAEKLDVQVVETSKIVLGPEHPDTLTSMNNLASTYRNQRRWTEAEKLEVQMIETRKSVLGPEHPDTLTSMTNLACTYRDQGRWKEAECLVVQAIEATKAVLGPEHPATLASMANLACIYQYQGRWTDAENLEIQLMEIFKAVLGPEHPNTLASMWRLSYTWKNQGRDSDALAMLEACVQLQNQQLGSHHPNTISAATTLKEWQTPAHRPSSHSSSSGRHEIHQFKSSTQASHCQAPEINHQSNQLVSTERLSPLDQPQKPLSDWEEGYSRDRETCLIF
jgi:nucleoside phosphorylase/tetratricopeptide (TPR) repeat protein